LYLRLIEVVDGRDEVVVDGMKLKVVVVVVD
jgi:hypothetical protein